MRTLAHAEAANAWERAKDSRQYKDDFSASPSERLEDSLERLSVLHSSRNHPLRYGSEENSKAPIPLLLIDTFSPISQRLVRERLNGES
jgi:hypothetical protein